MIGMRERVFALGGTMSVASTPNGVTVEAMVPRSTRQLHTVEALLSSLDGNRLCATLTAIFSVTTFRLRQKRAIAGLPRV